jgi:hypothetical protein
VNPGGEPERDDTGLPPVDIEIPDDARELDRDVQAYFRELRAERRSQRRRRLHPGLSKDGVVLPLLACCLILALITGTLLTVFTATSDQNLVPPAAGRASPNRSAPSASSTPESSTQASSSAAPSDGGTTAGPSLRPATLRQPDARLVIADKPIPLSHLFGIMLVVIPPRCRCADAVSRLADIGVSTQSGALLVGTHATIGEAQRYLERLQPSIATYVGVALDSQGALRKTVSARGLTAVVISPPTSAGRGRLVSYASSLTSSDLASPNAPVPAGLVKALKG